MHSVGLVFVVDQMVVSLGQNPNLPFPLSQQQDDDKLTNHNLCKAKSELRRFNARRKFRAGVRSVRCVQELFVGMVDCLGGRTE
jgi:hypothetical protein